MKKIKKVFSIVITFLMVSLMTITVFAVDGTPLEKHDIRKEETFQTTTTDFHYDFPKTIKENGKKYKYKTTDYTVISSQPIMRQEIVEHNVDYNNLYEKNINPPQTVEIMKDGKPLTVSLNKFEYSPTTIINRSEIVSAYTDFSYKTVKPEPEKTKTIVYRDEASGKEITTTLQLKELKEADGWAWRNDVEIPLKFIVYDAEYYALGDALIPYNNDVPAIQGYEKDILHNLNLDTEKYRITNVCWDGEPYSVGEVKYRNAIATGERYAANYVAIYESRVSLPNVQGFNAKATYTNSVDVESGEMQYQVKATAIYAPDYTIAYTVAGVSLAVIFIALFVVLILYFLGKKKKKEEINN